eukprot:418051_1
MTQSNRCALNEEQETKKSAYDYWANKIKCPNNHSLMPFYSTNSSQFATYTLHKFICDHCGEEMAKGENPFCCRQCDYDLCRECYRNEYKQLSTDGYGKLKYKAYDSPKQAPPSNEQPYHRPSLVVQFINEYQQKQKPSNPLEDIMINIASINLNYCADGIKIIINILQKLMSNSDVKNSKYDDINYRKLYNKLKIEESDECKYFVQLLCHLGFKLYHKKLGFYPQFHDLNNTDFKLLRLVYGDYNGHEWSKNSKHNEELCHAYHELKYLIGCNYKIDASNCNTNIANILLTNPWKIMVYGYCNQHKIKEKIQNISTDVVELIYNFGNSLCGVIKVNSSHKYVPILSHVQCNGIVVRYWGTNSVQNKEKTKMYVYCNALQY